MYNTTGAPSATPMLVSDGYTTSRTCVVTRTLSAIEHLQLLDQDYETVFHRT